MSKLLIRSHNTVENQRSLMLSTFSKRFFITATIVVTLIAGLAVGKIFGFTDYTIPMPGFLSKNKAADVTVATEVYPSSMLSPDQETITDPAATPQQNSAPGAAQGTAGGGSAPQSTAPVAPSSNPSSSCGNAAIPSGACVTILSLENSGAKNNPNVTVDTSQLPEGTVFRVDKSTWSQQGTEGGTVDSTATYSSYVYNLSLTLANQGGVWKITNYAQK